MLKKYYKNLGEEFMVNLNHIQGFRKLLTNFGKKIKGKPYLILLIFAFVIASFVFSFGYLNNTGKVNSNLNIVEDLNLEDIDHSALTLLKEDVSDLEKLNQIRKDIDYILKIKIKGYGINVDGKNVAIFKTRGEADKLLSEIMKPYTGNDNLTYVSFKENVKVTAVECGLNEFDDFDEVLYRIRKGTDEVKTHKIEKGENFWVIAEKYKIKVEDLIKANPDVEPERLQIGQEISLIVPKPLITVVTKERAEYEEKIPFETEYEETSALYKDEYRVKRAGKEGLKFVEANIRKENGIEVSREIIKETVTKEPVTEIVLKGTKEPPPKIGTGTFSKPTSRGTLSSRFGTRWGRRHEGIDIAVPVGTAVKAADGGVVVFAGYKGDYGYLVIIDHGANMQSYYAHLSKILVSKGDKVYKGQHIANSGNTGRSTGPHLHFEIRKNGVPVNPLNYVKY